MNVVRVRPGRWRQEVWINVLIIFLRSVQVIQARIPVAAGEQCSCSSVVWYCCVILQGDGAQCLQRQMVTQPPIELWPCLSMMVLLCTLDRIALYSATAFAGGIGSSLIYFYFCFILGYARHPFVLIQGIHHFYNGKQRPAPFHITQDLNWNTAVNHATWFYRARTENLWKQHLSLHCAGVPSPVEEPSNMRHFADLHSASLPTHPCVLPVQICWDSLMVE